MWLFARVTASVLVLIFLYGCAGDEVTEVDNAALECSANQGKGLFELIEDSPNMTDDEYDELLTAIKKAAEQAEKDYTLNENLLQYFANEYFVDGVPTGELAGLEMGVKADELYSHRAEKQWFQLGGSDGLEDMENLTCKALFVVEVLQKEKTLKYFICLDGSAYELQGSYEREGCGMKRIQ